MPKLPVVNPTTIFRAVITTAATTEFPAAARFSARIKSEGEMAGLPDMQELSPLQAESAKQIAAATTSRISVGRTIFGNPMTDMVTGQKWRLVLGFDA